MDRTLVSSESLAEVGYDRETQTLGSVDEVPHPKTDGCDEYEADVAVGGLVVSSGQSAAVLEL